MKSGINMAICRAAVLVIFLSATSIAARPQWKAGVAKVRITPQKSLWMAGFAARTKPSAGTLVDIYAKALALEDQSGKRAVMVTTDLIGFPAGVANNIAGRVARQYRVPRDRLLLNSSHTHSGPVLTNPLRITYSARMTAEQIRDIDDYTRELESKIVALVGTALKDLRPAKLSFGRSETNFAVNRRQQTANGFINGINPGGPVDHDVPLLRIDSENGQMRGMVFGYACHNTSLTATSYLYSGDYAGFAQQRLEQQHPGATALFLTGCGADANPLPRGTVELSRKYGEMLAAAAGKGIGGSLTPIRGPLKSAFDVFPLHFAPPPSREELQARLKDRNEDTRRNAQELLMLLDQGKLPSQYPYPLQVWQFGADLTLVAMSGEVVVDYVLRLKKELGAEKLWVSAYNNDVMGYIPSLRVLREGGYEGGGAMIGSRLPGPFAPSIEETIVGKVHELVAKVRSK